MVRPILDIARDDIEKYCEEKGLEPRRDHTNEEALYARNKIRLELLPLLRKEYNPNITETLNRLGRLAAEDKGYIYEKAAEAYITGEFTDREIKRALIYWDTQGLPWNERKVIFDRKKKKLHLENK